MPGHDWDERSRESVTEPAQTRQKSTQQGVAPPPQPTPAGAVEKREKRQNVYLGQGAHVDVDVTADLRTSDSPRHPLRPDHIDPQPPSRSTVRQFPARPARSLGTLSRTGHVERRERHGRWMWV